MIDFPLTDLDMKKFHFDAQNPEIKYDLFGIVNQKENLESKHFVSITRNPETGLFRRIDDKKIYYYNDISRAINPYAYLLFYVRKSLPVIERPRQKLLREGMMVNKAIASQPRTTNATTMSQITMKGESSMFPPINNSFQMGQEPRPPINWEETAIMDHMDFEDRTVLEEILGLIEEKNPESSKTKNKKGIAKEPSNL